MSAYSPGILTAAMCLILLGYLLNECRLLGKEKK